MALAPVDQLFEEIYQFLVSSPTPDQIIAYQAPAALQEQLIDLLEKNSSGSLTESEHYALNEFRVINRVMSRLKLTARKATNFDITM